MSAAQMPSFIHNTPPTTMTPEANGNLNLFPIEIFYNIFSFLNVRDLLRLEVTCKAFQAIVLKATDDRFEVLFRSHPILNKVCNAAEVLAISHRIKQIPTINYNLKKLRYIQSGRKEDMKNRADPNSLSNFMTPCEKNASPGTLARIIPNPNDPLFVTAHLMADKNAFSSINHIELEMLDPDSILTAAFATINAAAKPNLSEEEIEELLNQLGRLIPYCHDKNILLSHAAEMNLTVFFQKILDHCFSLHADRLLVLLSKRNRAEMIRMLFKKTQEFNLNFIPDNEYNERNSHRPGIHTALMIAANKGNLDALNELLTLKYIPRIILKHIIYLMRNFDKLPPQNQHDNGLLGYDRNDRAQNPYRLEIADRLDAEIQRRFPGEIDPQPEPDAVLENVHNAQIGLPFAIGGLQEDAPSVNWMVATTLQLEALEESLNRTNIAFAAIICMAILWNIYSNSNHVE